MATTPQLIPPLSTRSRISPLIITKTEESIKTRSRSASAIAREFSAGCLSEEVYRAGLPYYRFKIRQKLLLSLKWEMKYLVWIQKSLRNRFLDEYFLKTSLLGTHTFFMLFLPLFFFFGFPNEGRFLLYILATGGYVTSALKDAICLPRPFTPFIVRLAVGTHGREYGFPSTHSTNAISMACVLWTTLIGSGLFEIPLKILVGVLCASVVGGRIYTGMHSFVDVITGSTIGLAIFYFFSKFQNSIEAFTMAPGILPTVFTIILTLILVFIHPAPVEDCPCFEDTVAFISVYAGMSIGHAFTSDPINPTLGAIDSIYPSETVLIFASIIKVILGIFVIFLYRTVAKKVSHFILPKLFKLFSSFLLTRKGYIPGLEGYQESAGIKRVPSILDLTLQEEEVTDEETENFTLLSPKIGKRLVRRKLVPVVVVTEVVRQDADVVTKIICYSGIGWIASIGAPVTFEYLGLSI